MSELATSTAPERFGRYLLYPAIARGGMATVHTARLVGAEGFTRLVAAKRLHPQFADDPEFVTMFHDEACIASRIHHPNVVPVLDVVVEGGELILVQEYVHGVPLSLLMRAAHESLAPIDIDVVVAIITGVLAGLHAAHEAKDEGGHPLEIVHRDVSPQNVMVSVDGVPRLLDFGIAKARTSTHHTREGVFKGKLAYMAPEQLRMDGIDRAIDVYATGVLLWELLVNRRIFDGRNELPFVNAVVNGELPSIVEALAEAREAIGEERWVRIAALEPVVSRAMAHAPADRFATASDMLRALLDVRTAATSMAVSAWVQASGAEFLDQRQRTLAANEESWRRTSVYATGPSSAVQRRSQTATDDGQLRVDTPSGVSVVGQAAARPPSPLALTLSSAPPISLGDEDVDVDADTDAGDADAYRLELGASPLAALARRLRRSRGLAFAAVSALGAAGVLVALLRGPTPPLGAGVGAPAPPFARGLVATAEASSAGTSAAGTSPPITPPDPTAPEALVPPLAPPLSVKLPRAAPVAPTPPRAFYVSRPPPAAPHPSAGPAQPGATDCNPPFYFEGPKKVFKPSCL